MRLNFTLLFLLIAMFITAQQTEFVLQGRITDGDQNPVADAYIINIRSSSRFFSTGNGVFELKVQPRISDGFSQSEQVSQMIKSENRVMRTEASSVRIASFSPSQVIGKLSEKRKKRKEASLYESTRKLQKEEEKADDNTP